MAVALAERANARSRKLLYQRSLVNYEGDDPYIWQFCQEMALRGGSEGWMSWVCASNVARKSYEHGAMCYVSPEIASSMPIEIAELICSEPQKYPLFLVGVAQVPCATKVGAEAGMVNDVARRNKWEDCGPLG
jgi:hypothetical protein